MRAPSLAWKAFPPVAHTRKPFPVAALPVCSRRARMSVIRAFENITCE
ncbi:hypothetical protein OH686_07005 [Pseudomonas sp. SO81]|nr:hypothetical protein OH686_07005 [Pseudomonas sp. SO81]